MWTYEKAVNFNEWKVAEKLYFHKKLLGKVISKKIIYNFKGESQYVEKITSNRLFLIE